MKRHNISKLLAACAFLAGSLGMLGQAAAAGTDYKVQIDCHGTNGIPSWSHSGSTIVLEFLVGNEWIYAMNNSQSTAYGYGAVPSSLCNSDFELGGYLGAAMRTGMVTKFRIRNLGSDAFWVDQVKLTDTTTGRWWRWGVNNSSGYCFSTDSSDGNNKYCWNSKAYKTINFNL